MATLTGAQGISTGQYHAAILTNNDAMEDSCMKAGKNSGDLVVSPITCLMIPVRESIILTFIAERL